MSLLASNAARTVLRTMIVVLGVAGSTFGCSATPIMSYTCGTVPAEACHEQAQILEAAASGPVRNVTLACVGGGCTRARGGGEATVTLIDRTVYTRSWSYTGDTNTPPSPTCVGLPRDVCLLRVHELTAEVSPSHHLTGVTVTCNGTCDASGGDVVLVFLSEGGVRDEIGHTWGNPRP